MKKNFPKEKAIRAAASLLLAIFLWMMANASMDPNRTIRYSNIPIEYSNLKSELVVDNPVTYVNIKVEGATSKINKISKSNIKAIVNLSNISQAGEYTLEVEIQGLTDEVSINEISSKYILVKIGNYTDSESDFIIEHTGTASSGYVLIDIYHDDVTVSIAGSDNITSEIKQIKGIVDISGKSGNFSEAVKLHAYDANGNILEDVKITPATVNINVIISQLKSVPINVKTTGECDDGYSISNISLSENEITIAASSDILDTITSIDTQPIDITGKNNSFDSDISFALPDGVSLYNEKKYTAHVQIESISNKTFTYTNIQLYNRKQNYNYDLIDFDQVTISIIGQEETLKNISEDDITPYIDFEGLNEGEHEVKIQYELPVGVTVSATSPSSITVRITSE